MAERSHPMADLPVMQLVRELVRTYQGFTAAAFAQIEAASGLGAAEFDVLAALAGTEGLTFRDLSERTLIYKTTLTSVVDRLQKKELVERRHCTEDRRCIYVAATQAGQALFDQVFPEHVAFLQQRLSGLTDDELNTLRAGLAAVRQQFA